MQTNIIMRQNLSVERKENDIQLVKLSMLSSVNDYDEIRILYLNRIEPDRNILQHKQCDEDDLCVTEMKEKATGKYGCDTVFEIFEHTNNVLTLLRDRTRERPNSFV